MSAQLIVIQIDCSNITMCFNMTRTIQYTRSELFKYNARTSARLSHGNWKVIKYLGLHAQTPTKRGIKGTQIRHLNSNLSVDSIDSRDCGRFSFALWNAHSIRNKTTMCSSYILENSFDLMIITETWLSRHDEVMMRL